MANIEEVSGVFGGVKVNDENTNNVVENSENIGLFTGAYFRTEHLLHGLR